MLPWSLELGIWSFLPALINTARQTRFPRFGGIPGALGQVLGIGAGATAQRQDGQREQEQKTPAEIKNNNPHDSG